MVETCVITLDRESDRFRRFARLNAHLECTVFDGVNGAELDYADCVKRGFLTPECAESGMVTRGTLGCAISHWTLWWKAVYEKKSLLILEDDVVTHRDILGWIDQSESCRTADIVLFGINTDTVVEAVSPESVHQISIFGVTYPGYNAIAEKLALTKAADARLWRVLTCFGQCCYLITPQGAAKLVETVLPLRLDAISVPLITHYVHGISIDRRLNALYAEMDPYLTMPFLSWTPNTDSATR
jgi:GR25 family glycosyltransferase involved in LPS biosynthesis